MTVLTTVLHIGREGSMTPGVLVVDDDRPIQWIVAYPARSRRAAWPSCVARFPASAPLEADCRPSVAPAWRGASCTTVRPPCTTSGSLVTGDQEAAIVGAISRRAVRPGRPGPEPPRYAAPNWRLTHCRSSSGTQTRSDLHWRRAPAQYRRTTSGGAALLLAGSARSSCASCLMIGRSCRRLKWLRS